MNVSRTRRDHAAIVSASGPFLALLLACAFFASQSDRFLTGQNFSLILQQVVVVGVIAIGQTLIVLTAGIDLSCGMVMALGSIVMSKAAVDHGLDAGSADRMRAAGDNGIRVRERRTDHAGAAAAVHRHARHAQHRVRDHTDLLALSDRVRPSGRDGGARRHVQARRHRHHLRHRLHARGVFPRVGCAYGRPRRDGTSMPSATTRRRPA